MMHIKHPNPEIGKSGFPLISGSVERALSRELLKDDKLTLAEMILLRARTPALR